MNTCLAVFAYPIGLAGRMKWGNDDAMGSDYFVFTQQGFGFSTSLEDSHGGLHAINRPIEVGVAVALVALGTTFIQHREV